ncbi:MAG TPA: DJ-1/PfpI family protein [Microthrixaceae bacterium]|nr:DJ-1/PfpI family protein [Microthrixaceae bacterium]
MQIAIALFPGFEPLDAIGPYQVVTQLPDAEVVLCSGTTGIVRDHKGLLAIEVEHTYDDVASPDIVIVPGGFGTRALAHPDSDLVSWVRGAHESTTFTTSVCTGSLVLGAAGLLDGLDATTHWMNYDELAAFGARPTERRVVHVGKIITAAGVSSGIDMALYLVGLTHGDDVAEAVQLGIEYDPQPPYDAGAPSKARPEIRELVEAVISASQPPSDAAATTSS